MSPDDYPAMPFSYEAVSQVKMPEQSRQMPEALDVSPEDVNPVANRQEAAGLFADGKTMFAFDEMDGTPTRITSLEMLNSYTPDTIGWMEPEADSGARYMPEASYDSIMERYKETPSTEVSAKGRVYSPIIRDLLQRRKAGEVIPKSVMDRAITEHFPSYKVKVPKSPSDLPSQAKVLASITPDKLKKHLETMKEGLPSEGEKVTVRQDVPAMTDFGVGVVTTTTKNGKIYRPSTRIKDPVFVLNEIQTEKIGMGEGKAPHIVVNGKWVADQSFPKDLDTWTQVGFNPDRHSYYYERGTNKMVVSGEEALQIGNTVFVKKPDFGDPMDPKAVKRYMPEKVDADYMKAVEAGDVEAQQRIVDKAAGNTPKVYRGDAESFNQFNETKRGKSTRTEASKAAYFFTDSASEARAYANFANVNTGGVVRKFRLLGKGIEAPKGSNPNASLDLLNKANKDGYDYVVFKDTSDIIDPNEYPDIIVDGQRVFIDSRGSVYDMVNEALSGTQKQRESVANDLQDYLDNFDSIEDAKAEEPMMFELIDALRSDPSRISTYEQKTPTVYAVFNPEMAKSADPITRDDSGNIIPPSKRFNTESKDIRYMPEKIESKKTYSIKNKIGMEFPKSNPKSGYTEVKMETSDGNEMIYKFQAGSNTPPDIQPYTIKNGEWAAITQADRHDGVDARMGGVAYPFLESNNIVITASDGNTYRPVWASLGESTTSSMKSMAMQTTNGTFFVHLMGEEAHISNNQTFNDYFAILKKAKISEESKKNISIVRELASRKTEIELNNTSLYNKARTSKTAIDATKLQKLDPDIAKFFRELGGVKSSKTRGNEAKAKEQFDIALNKLKEKEWFAEFESSLNIKKYANRSARDTFHVRGAQIDALYSIPDVPSVKKYLSDTSDFVGGKTGDIVAAVQVSKNPEAFRIYTGDDPVLEAKMKPLEREIRDKLLASGKFKAHVSYPWVVLGPGDGSNFMLDKSVSAETLFPEYKNEHPSETVKNGSGTTILGAMRMRLGIPMIVGEKKK
jgi:hypothetical protein